MLGDLASDVGTIQSIKNASLSLEAEEVRWDVTVCIKLDFIVKSIRDSPRPSKTQGVPPNAVNLISRLSGSGGTRATQTRLLQCFD